MNAQQELALVTAAKAGSYTARDTLFGAYAGEIERAHASSARGLNPKTFGYGYNKKGYAYEADSGRLFFVFVNALKRYKPGLVDMTKIKNVNPFLSYLKYEICNRAMDEVRKEKTYSDRNTLISKLAQNLAKRAKDSDADDAGNEMLDGELVQSAFDCEGVEYANACERNDEEMRQAVRQLISVMDADSKERETLETFLEVLGYEKNVIPAIAEKMGVSRPTVYKYLDESLANLKARVARDIHDLLVA